MNNELRRALREAGPVLRPIVLGKASKGDKVVDITEPATFGEAIQRLSR